MNPTPHLILITTDQQRCDTIHAAGNPFIFTPHLDWLHDTGINFSSAYSEAPICCAARACLLTGLPHYQSPGVGYWGQPSAPSLPDTLPSLLTQHGYQTRSVGKLHLHPARVHWGFEHLEPLETYYRDRRGSHNRFKPGTSGLGQNELDPIVSTVPASESLTQWITERGIDFLETRDPTRPFFLQLGFSKPHPPLDPSPEFWALYANQEVPAPFTGDWSHEYEKIPPGFRNTNEILAHAERYSRAQLDQIRRAYYACISQVDYALGLFFARLRELGLLENSIIVFTSDHGEMLGDHGLGGKTVYLEGSSHVPLLVRAGSNCTTFTPEPCHQLVGLRDIVPTFLTAAGVDREKWSSLPGRNLIETAESRSPDRPFFGALSDQLCTIQDRWKYLYTSNGGGELLFSLQDDPHESVNLSELDTARSRKQHLRNSLAAELARYRHSLVDPAPPHGFVRNPPSIEKRWPGFHHPHHTIDDLIH